MNIVFTASHHRPLQIMATVFTASGYNTIMWSPDVKPIYDMLEELRPEYLFVSPEVINQTFINAVTEYKTKIVVFGVQAPEPLKELIKLVVVPFQTPKPILDNINANCPVHEFLPCADLARYTGGHYVHKMASDVLYLSNFEINLSQRAYILRDLESVANNTDFKLKIVGTTVFPLAEFIGLVDFRHVPDMLKSTKVAIDFNLESAFDCATNRAACVTNIDNSLYPSFKNEEDLCELVTKIVTDDKYRNEIIKKAYKIVINKDTSFHRVGDIAKLLNDEDLEKNVLNSLNRIKGT